MPEQTNSVTMITINTRVQKYGTNSDQNHVLAGSKQYNATRKKTRKKFLSWENFGKQ